MSVGREEDRLSCVGPAARWLGEGDGRREEEARVQDSQGPLTREAFANGASQSARTTDLIFNARY